MAAAASGVTTTITFSGNPQWHGKKIAGVELKVPGAPGLYARLPANIPANEPQTLKFIVYPEYLRKKVVAFPDGVTEGESPSVQMSVKAAQKMEVAFTIFSSMEPALSSKSIYVHAIGLKPDLPHFQNNDIYCLAIESDGQNVKANFVIPRPPLLSLNLTQLPIYPQIREAVDAYKKTSKREEIKRITDLLCSNWEGVPEESQKEFQIAFCMQIYEEAGIHGSLFLLEGMHSLLTELMPAEEQEALHTMHKSVMRRIFVLSLHMPSSDIALWLEENKVMEDAFGDGEDT